METKTHISNVLHEVSDKARYDAEIGMLNTLLSEKLSAEEKENLLFERYGIETSVEVKGVLNTMCNLSERIEEKGIEKGIEKSIEKLLQKKYSVAEVAEMLDQDIDLVKKIEERICFLVGSSK